MKMLKNITIVVRSVGERTSEKCVEYLIDFFGRKNVFLIENETPFSQAVKKTFLIGIKRKKKWTLAIDADVFLFKDKIKDFIFEAEKFVSKQKNVYCLEGKLFDKFSQTYREVGCHLYNTKYLKKALKYVDDGKDTMRPETYIKEKMAQCGYGFYVSEMRIGIHDFFQNPKNIIKKAILHCKKHANIANWIEIWKKEAQNDDDFVYALKGNEIYNSLDDKTIIVDSQFMDNLLFKFNIKFEEKNILTNCEIDSVLKKYNQNICEYEDKKFEIIFPVKSKKTIKDMIFSKEKNKDKRIIYFLGVKFSYKKNSKNSFLNSFLKNIKPYKTASHKIWTLNKDDRNKTLKLDWNEATIPPSPKVISRLKELVEFGDFYNLYPATENKKILDLLSKYTGLKDVIQNIKNFITKETLLISLLNGITSEDEILREYPDLKVLYSYFVGHTSTRIGRKIIFDGIGNIIFGSIDKNYENEIKELETFFIKNNITYKIPEDINYARFCKFMMNVGLNQTSALTRANYAIFQKKGTNYDFMLELFKEVSLIAKAMGVKNYKNLIPDALNYLNLMIPEGKSSMLQDIENGNKTEVEIFSKTIIQLAHKYNLNVPYNKIVYELISALEESIIS